MDIGTTKRLTELSIESLRSLLREHDRELSPADITRCNSDLLTARSYVMIVRYITQLTSSCSQYLNRRVNVNVVRYPERRELPSILRRFNGSNVLLTFKVYAEELKLLISNEFAQDLTALVLKRMPSTVLVPPHTETITAVSYFAAKLLAEAAAFTHQRIYLKSAQILSTAEQLSDEPRALHASELLEHFDLSQTNIIYLLLNLENSEYDTLVTMSAGLSERLGHYAKHSVVQQLGLPELNRHRVQFSIGANVRLRSLLDLLQLQPGQLLEFEQGKSLPLAQGFIAQDSQDKANGVFIPIDIKLDSTQNTFQLRIR